MVINIKGIIGEVKEAEGKPFTNLQNVIAQVKRAGDADNYLVNIDSIGGLVTEGYAIHDYLVSLKKPITTNIIGECCSIASVIFLAGNVRKMPIKGATLMIHTPSIDNVSGNSAQLKAIAAEMDDIQSDLEKFYAKKLQIEKTAITALVRKETFLTPQEAYDLGFVTEITNKTGSAVSQRAVAYYKQKPMAEKKTNKIAEFLKNMADLIDGGNDNQVKNLSLKLEDGTEVEVQTEAEKPAVGDAVTVGGEPAPNGEHTLDNGDVITVADGVISEIKPKEAEAENADVTSLKAELEDVKSKLTAQEATLKEKSEQLQNALDLLEKASSKFKANATAMRTNNKGGNEKKEGLDVAKLRELAKSAKQKSIIA